MRFSGDPKNELKPGAGETAGHASGGLFTHFVQRTDNDFNGVHDQSLIGEDIGDDDEEDEDER